MSRGHLLEQTMRLVSFHTRLQMEGTRPGLAWRGCQSTGCARLPSQASGDHMGHPFWLQVQEGLEVLAVTGDAYSC